MSGALWYLPDMTVKAALEAREQWIKATLTKYNMPTDFTDPETRMQLTGHVSIRASVGESREVLVVFGVPRSSFKVTVEGYNVRCEVLDL